tara:strand:- start:1467 stop:1622 length:156 start_codon:yes stop_codon:yes gene_type:complete
MTIENQFDLILSSLLDLWTIRKAQRMAGIGCFVALIRQGRRDDLACSLHIA